MGCRPFRPHAAEFVIAVVCCCGVNGPFVGGAEPAMKNITLELAE